ncbi:MAG: hypothetical protein JM58_00575 [Peptococcaceae bacterium BICA1-8]|nr:MAG: hypothetical protein JM58_00575 [Peptococcaceae bacterium BICA1-8]
MKKKSKKVFALDIGTRSIVGLLLEDNGQGVHIKEMVSKEHDDRAMLDGQIHNIPKVSTLLYKVKKEMETKLGFKLKKAAVAAAGRALKTIKTAFYLDVNNQIQIKHEDVLNLELKAAQNAQALLLTEQNNDQTNEYYCVGYSITKYFLDNTHIGNLIGQKGSQVGLEIVAAFLPKVVVDSLQVVLTENGLELANITLEPIAAINAILPPSMRKLNLALVDIGAGTSDIAISYDGAITGYGMVPIAGDEITEALCEKFLLDFNDGELLKRKLYLSMEEELSFSDILGIEHSLKGLDIVKDISDTIKMLAEKISAEIISLNINPPQAVILIGGGSLTPLIVDYIADSLGLSKQRVAVQRASSIKDIIDLPQEFQGPEIITPIGIGLTAMKHLTLGFIPVQVNNYGINLLNLGKNTVLDALLAAGIDTGKVYGKPGLAITVEVNGKIKTFPGSQGQKAIIRVNGAAAALDTQLQPRSKIEYIKAQDGSPGKGWARDLLGQPNWIEVDGKKKYLTFEIIINGKNQSSEVEIKDGDKIFIREITQIGELFELWGLEDFIKECKLSLIINEIKKEITLYPFKISRNGIPLSLFENVKPQDKIILEKNSENNYSVSEIMDKYLVMQKEEKTQLSVTVNEQLVSLSTISYQIVINGLAASLTDRVECGDVLEITYKFNKSPILVDVFPQINFLKNPPLGKSNLEIVLNGQEAEYTSILKEGDNISLIWK